MPPILEIAAKLGLAADDLEPYGAEIAKVKPQVRRREPKFAEPKLVLVKSVCVALREPSLGPCFGMKGGGAGGGRCQVLPAERINLHFTGDFHAVTAAHNLLAALLDNEVYFENSLRIDPRRILWQRVLDVNDRALRHVIVGLGGRHEGVPRETGFDITAASELMAMLCLAEDVDDLRARIDRTLVAFTREGEPVTAGSLSATGALLALLRDALLPNLVGTTEGAAALVHGGPFANIAHGCSSVIATKTAMHLAEWTITEAGFGFDLGAEKFFDIKCRSAGLDTAAVVLVATVRALKLHGGAKPAALDDPDPAAVERGLPNLDKHVENIRCFRETPVVALNRFQADTPEEIAIVRRHCEQLGAAFAETTHFVDGGKGAAALAEAVVAHAESSSRPFRPLYDLTDSVPDKITAVAQKMYGAAEVEFTKRAARDLKEIERLGYAALPVCIAKTPSSLSDDPHLRGRPKDFEITVERILINSGAGLLVVLTGDILRMPGLPRRPRAHQIDLIDGKIIGLD
jgi:formate--tetrahydrofolate ligase